MAQKRLDILPLTLKGGYAMMVFQCMHLDTGKKSFICSGPGTFRSFNSVTRPWIVIFVGRNINHGKDCSITSERYITVRMFTQIVTNMNLNTQKIF